MKKFGIALILSSIIIAGCTPTPKKKKTSSEQESTSNVTSQTQVTSQTAPSSNVTPSQTSNISTTQTSNPTSATSQTPSTSQTDPVIDLGKQKISYVVDYINNHPITVPTGMKGAVDYNTKVTVDGLALQKIDLRKETSNYGLNFSSRYKVILGDETGYIGAASSTFYDKVSNYDGNPDSKYTVTGYLSIYLGNPEIFVTEYTLNKSLSVTFDAKKSSEGQVSFQTFFETARDTEYNCKGDAYGKMYTFTNVTSYHWVSDSSYQKFAWITDGYSIIKTIAHNRPNVSKGKVFNLVGLLSMQDYSPAIWIIDVEEVSSQNPVELDVSFAKELSITELKNNKTSQDDTNERFPEYTLSWASLYKTTGYLTTVEQGGKYYIGIRDEYYSGTEFINGKDNARANMGVALFHNSEFWNIDSDHIYTTVYGELVDSETPVEIYYIFYQLTYYTKKTCWDIMVLPSTFPTI